MLFETICILDGNPQFLEYHQERFSRTCNELFNLNTKIKLEEQIVVPGQFSSGQVRCRIDYQQEIQKIEYSHYQRKQITKVALVDSDIEYTYKWSDRSGIDRLVTSFPGFDDLIIVKQGLLTDASYSNIALSLKGEWFTPAKPLLQGTTRARLLKERVLQEVDISVESLSEYQEIVFYNAMRGFDPTQSIPVASLQSIHRS